MSVKEIEAAINQLTQNEREQVRAWLDQIEAEARERQPSETHEERRDRQLAEYIRKGHEEFSSLVGKERPFGLCAGKLKLPADFNDPLPEGVLRDFEGG